MIRDTFLIISFVMLLSGCAINLDRGNIVHYPFGDTIVVSPVFKLTATDQVRATYVKPDNNSNVVDDLLFIFSGEAPRGDIIGPFAESDRIINCNEIVLWSNPNGIRESGYIFSDRYVCGKFRSVNTRTTSTKIFFATQMKNVHHDKNYLEQIRNRLYNSAVTVIKE